MNLVFDNVDFSYGRKQIFMNFSTIITSGSSVALMGVSGSGKTTFLKLAAGLLNPQSGTVSTDPNGAAIVFQNNRLVPHLTSKQNILLVSPKANADTLLAELGLDGEQDTLPNGLSGGMARRVALARALAYIESEMLLLDEPFNGLDDITRKKTAAFILKYAAGRIIIVATHDEADASLLGAKILRLK